MRSLFFATLFVVAILLAGCAVLVRAEPVALPTATAVPATSTPAPPDSPLMAAAPAADVALATFTWLELAGIVDNVGGVLRPGSYTCDGEGDALTFCRVNGADIPGGELCVWPGRWGACE